MSAIERSLIICYVARSGSLYLCGLIGSTELAGWPFEPFGADYEHAAREEHGLATDEEYFAWVKRHSTTPNGVFATKFSWNELQGLLGRLRRIHGDDREDVALLAREFPSPVFVWLRRRDVVAQAVSWARAGQTKQWASTQRASREPVFDFDLIHRCAGLITSQSAAWAEWFATNDVAAHEVAYEDVLEDPHREVGKIVSLLGLELPADQEVEPELQRDELNAEWGRLYRARLGEEQWFPNA